MVSTGIFLATTAVLISLAHVHSYKLAHFRVGVTASRSLNYLQLSVQNSNDRSRVTLLRDSEPASSQLPTLNTDVPQRNGLLRAYRKVKLSLHNFLNSLAKWFYQLVASLRLTGRKSSQPLLDVNSTATGFVSLPSVPINKIPSLSIGKQYAQARLAEIESYLNRGSRGGAGKRQRKYTSGVTAVIEMRSVADLSDDQLHGKRVLVRCDLDVPVSDGKITNDARLRSSLPTIQHLISKGAKVILCGHLGTPSGKGYEAAHSLAPVAAQLSALLAKNVALVPDCIGISVQRAVSEMNPGDVILLENVRFYAEEEANDAHFALQLSRNADVYVNDAFAASRGATASTTGVSAQVTPAVSGKSLHQELSFGNKLLHNPARPFIAVVGDNKAHTEGSAGREEMAELEALVEMADVLVLAGSIAAPFLKARGLETGAVLVSDSQLEFARRIQARAATRGVAVHLLHDPPSAARTPVDAGTLGARVADSDVHTSAELRQLLSTAKTVFWRGALSMHASAESAADTAAIVEALSGVTEAGGVTVLCGQEAAAVEKAGLYGKVSHVSFEDLLLGRPLAGVEALGDK